MPLSSQPDRGGIQRERHTQNHTHTHTHRNFFPQVRQNLDQIEEAFITELESLREDANEADTTICAACKEADTAQEEVFYMDVCSMFHVYSGLEDVWRCWYMRSVHAGRKDLKRCVLCECAFNMRVYIMYIYIYIYIYIYSV